jgi:hypothetical protein
MRRAGLVLLLASWASSASAQCAEAPSYRAPDWGASIAGGAPLTEAQARARIARGEGEADLLSLAEAYRVAHEAGGEDSLREASIRTYERLLAQQPQHPKLTLALYRLGRLHRAAGAPERARAYDARLAGQHPLSPYTIAMYVALAEDRLAAGDAASAANYAERAATYHDRADLPRSALGAYARYLHGWALRASDPSAARVVLDAARASAVRARARALVTAIDRDRCAFAP